MQLAGLSYQPVLLDSGRLVVHSTYGVAQFPPDGLALDELMRRADLALDQGKHGG